MAVKKIKWQTLVSNIGAVDIFNSMDASISEVDTLLNEKLENYEETPLADLSAYVQKFLEDNNDNVWKDMDIYISSFVENDGRFILLLKNKFREYIGFYLKVLNDEGLQRHLVYAKTYGNDGNSSSLERGTNSNTPQNSALYDPSHPESDALFDQAIADYASNIDKNKASTTSHTEGTSDTTVSGTTWDEAKRNVQMFFYNELKDFIFSLPERIYSHYSLSTIPAPELAKKWFEHFAQVREMFYNE